MFESPTQFARYFITVVFRLSGQFGESGFVRLDLPGFFRSDLFGSKSPMEGTRELIIAAKFDLDTGRPHKKRTTDKDLNLKFLRVFGYFGNIKLKKTL